MTDQQWTEYDKNGKGTLKEKEAFEAGVMAERTRIENYLEGVYGAREVLNNIWNKIFLKKDK